MPSYRLPSFPASPIQRPMLPYSYILAGNNTMICRQAAVMQRHFAMEHVMAYHRTRTRRVPSPAGAEIAEGRKGGNLVANDSASGGLGACPPQGQPGQLPRPHARAHQARRLAWAARISASEGPFASAAAPFSPSVRRSRTTYSLPRTDAARRGGKLFASVKLGILLQQTPLIADYAGNQDALPHSWASHRNGEIARAPCP